MGYIFKEGHFQKKSKIEMALTRARARRVINFWLWSLFLCPVIMFKFHISTTPSFPCRAPSIFTFFTFIFVCDLYDLNGASYDNNVNAGNLEKSFPRPLVQKFLKSDHF